MPTPDAASLMRLRTLELRARVIVEGFWSGIHRSPYHGFSSEFSEYRQYAVGDDPRHIDWRVYARSDRYFIKKFEDETNLRCRLLLDCSRSMAYSSGEHTKHHYAATLAATLALFLSKQGDAVGLTTFDHQITNHIPVRNRPGHLRRLMLALEREPVGIATDFGGPLESIAERHNRRGLFILFSDLLAPIDTLQQRLASLRSRGHEVVVFQILDPRELDLDLAKPAQFEDLESGQTFYIDPALAARDYKAKLEAHLESIRSLCQGIGIDCHQLTTDTPFDQALHHFVTDRQRATPQATRVRQNPQ